MIRHKSRTKRNNTSIPKTKSFRTIMHGKKSEKLGKRLEARIWSELKRNDHAAVDRDAADLEGRQLSEDDRRDRRVQGQEPGTHRDGIRQVGRRRRSPARNRQARRARRAVRRQPREPRRPGPRAGPRGGLIPPPPPRPTPEATP